MQIMFAITAVAKKTIKNKQYTREMIKLHSRHENMRREAKKVIK